MIVRRICYFIAVIVLIVAFQDLQRPAHTTLWKELKKQEQQQKKAKQLEKTKKSDQQEVNPEELVW